MGAVQKRGVNLSFKREGESKRGKSAVLHKSLFWLLRLLFRGIPLFFSSSSALAPSFTELYVFPHFFCALVFPVLLLTFQLQPNLLASVLLFLWVQIFFFFLNLLSHTELPPPFTFVRGTLDMMIYSERHATLCPFWLDCLSSTAF